MARFFLVGAGGFGTPADVASLLTAGERISQQQKELFTLRSPVGVLTHHFGPKRKTTLSGGSHFGGSGWIRTTEA